MSDHLTVLPPARGLGSAVGWGWVFAPSWWLAQFTVRYAMVGWACRHGSPRLVAATGAAALLVALVVVAGMWRKRPSGGEALPVFLQRGARWSAAFFAGLILVQLLPDLFLDPCRR